MANTSLDMPSPLFTVGYEGRDLTGFLDQLEQAGVARVVDVRELPLSRRKGFSKTALGDALSERGIDYVHVRLLGNPKPNRERYWAGDVEGGAAVYREHLHGAESYGALVELAKTVTEAATCLLCFEADHERCHRDVIVDSLAELRSDLRVHHI